MPALLSGGSPKIDKSDEAGLGYLTKIMYLAPATLSGHNVCPWSSPGCRAGCLNKSGRGYCGSVQDARIRKTRLLFENVGAFRYLMFQELDKFVKRCVKLGVKPAVRLNGTSDVAWEKVLPDMFTGFPQIQFYDYTKSINRVLFCQSDRYHLTFSRSEEPQNHEDCKLALRLRCNVAVVFKNGLPKTYMGYPVIDGDKHDLRFLDPENVVVGLKAKGRARKDTSGFVVDAEGCK